MAIVHHFAGLLIAYGFVAFVVGSAWLMRHKGGEV